MSFKSIIYGKYLLLDRIAVGGMAEVFKAKTFGVHGFERLLVIKRILPHLTQDQEFIEMFIDEAKIAVELTHANICQVSDLGKIDNNYFIAMEYINGKDLRAILKKSFTSKNPIGIASSVYIMLEALKGLDYAHQKTDSGTGKPLQLIHRDISPQNIMISYHGEIKIVDFGIAKTESKVHRTQAGVLKGKFGYMSPEQASGRDLDQRTDLFSLAIIFFEMLSGRRLFHYDTDFKTLDAIKKCHIPSIRKYNPDVSPELETILFKALAKDPDDRLDSAHAFQSALSREFYTQFPDFTVKTLSSYLQDIFKAEIIEEQEAIKRSMDMVSPQLIEKVEEAGKADNESTSPSARLSGSFNNTQSKILSTNGSRNFLSRIFDMLARFWKVLVILLGLIFVFYFLFSSNKNKRNNAPSPQETAQTLNQTVLITSQPPGAALRIEQKTLGVTPLKVELEPGQVYELSLSLNDYEDFNDQILIRENQDTLSYELRKMEPLEVSIFVDSVPQGADILINGEPIGKKTPSTLNNMPTKQQLSLSLEKVGFKPAAQNIYVTQPLQEFFFNLEKQLSSLKINISPSSADIRLDGEKVGRVIENLESGKNYELSFSAPGYHSTQKTITLESAVTEVDIELRKRVVSTGYINISAIPWANVIIDGKKVGTTPILNLKLNVGKRTIIFQHQDYEEIKKVVTIKKGQNETLVVNFN